MMYPPAGQPTDVQVLAARQHAEATHTTQAVPGGTDERCSLARSALAFAALALAGERRGSHDAPFIEHPLEVAGLLHHAGCSDALIAAGLLHDLVAKPAISVAQLGARFGVEVANLVQAVTDDPSIGSYRERKQMLREQVRSAGADAALLFAADKISNVRELSARRRCNRVRVDAEVRDSRAQHRQRRYDQLRLEHYHKSLLMLEDVAPRHPLVGRLATELDGHRAGAGDRT